MPILILRFTGSQLDISKNCVASASVLDVMAMKLAIISLIGVSHSCSPTSENGNWLVFVWIVTELAKAMPCSRSLHDSAQARTVLYLAGAYLALTSLGDGDPFHGWLLPLLLAMPQSMHGAQLTPRKQHCKRALRRSKDPQAMRFSLT